MMTAPSSKPIQDNPYPGPRPFGVKERRYFFGREDETEILTALVMAQRAVLFFAQSGAGKSSLLWAGLVPALTRHRKMSRSRRAQRMRVFPIATVGRGMAGHTTQPIKNIYVFSSLLALFPKADPDDLVGLTLTDALARFFPNASAKTEDKPGESPDHGQAQEEPSSLQNTEDQPALPTPPTLLIFDQFEEIFTTHPDRWPEREAFFQQVDQALTEYEDLHVLFSMREDYIAELTPYANLLFNQLRPRFRLERLQYDAALQAVTQPAAEAGRAFAEGVAERLVDDLRRSQAGQKRNTIEEMSGVAAKSETYGAYVEPVHLQIVCRQLWEKLPEDRDTIEADDVQRFGDVDQALTGFYESALRDVIKKTRIGERRLREWFGSPLITSTGTRGLVYRGESETKGLPNIAVDILNDAYIIRTEIRGDDTWYELAHDRLVEPISKANETWRYQRQKRLRQVTVFIALAVVMIIVGVAAFFWRQQMQDADRVQEYIDKFDATQDPNDRLEYLAALFEIGNKNEEDGDRARKEAWELYNGLDPEEKVELFEDAAPDKIGQVMIVVKGTYISLGMTDSTDLSAITDTTDLIRSMNDALEGSDKERLDLTNETELWLKGRTNLKEGDYESAKSAYENAIGINEHNPATHFELAIVLVAQEEYSEALFQFDAVIRLEEELGLSDERKKPVGTKINENDQLYSTLWDSEILYPALVVLVHTPTPTKTATPVPPTNTSTPVPPNTPTPTITPTRGLDCGFKESTFLERNGEVVIEAEHHTRKNDTSAHKWENTTDFDDFSGTAAVQARPNIGENTGSQTDGPELRYDVMFESAGDYYVYVRGLAPRDPDPAGTGVNDSIHVGLNDTPITTDDGSQGLDGFVDYFTWQNRQNSLGKATKVTVSNPGVHTLHLWMREDGVVIDKIWLSLSPHDEILNTSDYGPEESFCREPSFGCSVDAPTDFDTPWRTHQELGCPVAPVPVGGGLSWQHFQNGDVFWSSELQQYSEDRRQYIVALNDGSWRSYSDDDIGPPECPSEDPPDEWIVPDGGIGRLWCGIPGLAEQLRFAKTRTDDGNGFLKLEEGSIWRNRLDENLDPIFFVFFGQYSGKYIRE